MRNFLNRGNKGNKMEVEVTTKSISIMILLPLLPLLPVCNPSRESWKNCYVYAQNSFPKCSPLRTKQVTEVTEVTEAFQIPFLLLPLTQNRGNSEVTTEVTGRLTQ
jgi:hypothetical protein